MKQLGYIVAVTGCNAIEYLSLNETTMY